MNSLRKSSEFCDSFRFDRKIEETETEFSSFYEIILKSLYKIPDIQFNKIRQSLGNIRSFKNPDIEIHETVDFEEKSDRCAYVFAYSIIHSIVMYDRFSDMMKHNPTMLRKILSMKKLRLCILGGGPAFEVAAICKLLSRVFAQCACDKKQPLQVHVTVIDICAEWEIEARSIISSLSKELCTGNYIEVDFSFIEADLIEDFSQEIIKAVKKSHIVTMLKFASEINETCGEKKMLGMIHKILQVMSKKSCLFILDSSGGGVFKKVDRMVDGLSCTARIYGPSLHYRYKLGPDTVDNFSAGVKGVFRRLECTIQTTISCSAWMNVDDMEKLEEMSLGNYVNTPASVLKDLERHKSKEKQPKIKIKKVMNSKKLMEENTISCSALMNVENMEKSEEMPLDNYVTTPASVLKDLEKHKSKEKQPKVKIKKVMNSKNLMEQIN